MSERRGDEGFAVATQSIGGGSGRRRRGPGRIGVAIVLLASLGLVVVGFLGPRISNPPNFDLGYFGTPTPRDTPCPTPRPTPVDATPFVTPLPVLTRPEGAPPVAGDLILVGTAIQRLDLATGTTEDLVQITQWQDGVVRLGDDRVACICIVSGFDDRGATRSVRLIVHDTATDASVSSDLATYASSPEFAIDQPDPLFDAALDRDAAQGLLATATRTATEWRISVRGLDPRAGSSGPDVPLGAIAVPVFPGPSPTPTSTPSEQTPSNIYLDGPHLRLSPDGRTAFVFGVAQRYQDYGEPAFTRGAWRIRIAPDGSIEDVAPFADFGKLPTYCFGTGFVGNDRLVAICAEQDSVDPNATRWTAHVFDADGRLTRSVGIASSGQYGYAEPLIDDANARLFLWDQVDLRIVRVDLTDGAVASAKFDAAASTTDGVAPGGAPGPPSWHDTESALQQSPFDVMAGSLDGRRLYATGVQPREGPDFYGQRSLGVFVIDPQTLALVQHWSPVANDTAITVLADGRVAVSAQPGMNAAGDQVPWEGSLTIREAADGAIVARYGRLSPDMPPIVLRP
jgi:hypothetical protein